MANPPIKVEYNKDLGKLAKLLGKAQRKGDFATSGRIDIPMPRLEIQGAGVVSFPLPAEQARRIEAAATQAPYGRGEETIVDTSVRQVWQLNPDQFSLGGSSWQAALDTILDRAVEGLGCGDREVKVDLYKLLLYAPGGFFKAHRDTEKSPGMFGTLVISLPSFHSGGELQVRHAGKEVRIDLAGREVSQISYAAFYADCEHEVKPVAEGFRLCLIYNLAQVRGAGAAPGPVDYSDLTREAAKMLGKWASEPLSAPKIAYLLEHQYSPSGLSFAGLKNKDAGAGEILRHAAEIAGLNVCLGIVHIEETGAAEVEYEPRGWGRRYSRGESSSGPYTIWEVTETECYISDCVDASDHPASVGRLPLSEGEVLPAGALDGEKPDEDRVTEATGNEGATFERAYHRAAVVLWPQEKHLAILLQSGVAEAVPWFAAQARAKAAAGLDPQARELLAAQARAIIDTWESASEWNYYRAEREQPAALRTSFLDLLRELEDREGLADFITRVMTKFYDGGENRALADALRVLPAELAAPAPAALISAKLGKHPLPCAKLLASLASAKQRHPGETPLLLSEAAKAAIELLHCPHPGEPELESRNWWSKPREPMTGQFAAELLKALGKIDALAKESFAQKAVKAMVASPAMFPPAETLAPALGLSARKSPGDSPLGLALRGLWVDTALALLARSEWPPEPPIDWAEPAKLSCTCGDCRALERFARHPAERVARFALVQHRRTHLEGAIQSNGLDMQFQTDTRGRPHTLVCSKTRRRFADALRRRAADVAALKTVLESAPALAPGEGAIQERIRQARERKPREPQDDPPAA